jgi:hypothetical protein
MQRDLRAKGAGSLRGSTARVTSILAIPYGYTVTLWSAGALAFVRLGPPGVGEILGFVLGACLAFLGLGSVGAVHLEAEVPMRVPAIVVFNVVPILVALLVALVPLAWLGRPYGFFAASLLATLAYVLSLALVVRLASGGALPE